MAVRLVQLVALVLALLGAVTLGLGIAQFIATYFLVFSPLCKNYLASCIYAEDVVYAFIMPGVWGSIAAFATGILAIKAFSNMDRWRTVFSTISFVSAAVFIPGMISVSIVNAVKVVTSPDGGKADALYNITTSYPNTTSIIFILPLVITGAGFIEFFLTAGLFIYACVCLKPILQAREPEPSPPEPKPERRRSSVALDFVYPPPPVTYSPYGPLPYRRPTPFYGDPTMGAGPVYRPGFSNFRYFPGRLPPPPPPMYAPAGQGPYPLPYPYPSAGF